MSALMRIAAWTLAIGLVALPLVAVLNGWIAGDRWPMRSLAVTGEFRQVDEAAVREAVLPMVQQGFFAVDLGRVRDAVSNTRSTTVIVVVYRPDTGASGSTATA